MIHTCQSCADAWCENCEGLGPCEHGRSYCSRCDPNGTRCRECAALDDMWRDEDRETARANAAGIRSMHDPDHGELRERRP